MCKLLFRRLCEGGINLCDYYCNISTSSMQQLLIFKDNRLPSTQLFCKFSMQRRDKYEI